MNKVILAAALACMLAAPTASAQMTVIGGGLAKDCFNAAKYRDVSSEKGIEICTRAIRFETMDVPNRAATYTNRGVLYMRSGDYDRALKDYARAKDMRPEAGEIYVNEGAAYIFMKEYELALASLDQAVALGTKEMHAAHYNRGIAREYTGDIAGAYEDYQKALEYKPEWDYAERQIARFKVETN